MKYYDYKKARDIISAMQDDIDTAALGMEEDWFWTAQTIFEHGKTIVNLFNKDLVLAGINGSYWATPTLKITLKSGKTYTIPCYYEAE
jgi:hypothetical protein